MLDAPIPFSLPPQESIKAQSPQLVLDGKSLSIEQVTQFIKKQHHVSLCKRAASPDALQVSCDVMAQQLNDGKQIYGVNTLFGGLANLGVDDPIALQQELITSHHSGAGNDLAIDDVRVAMLLRVNSICPLLEQKASPLSVHFPVHAEQFNQNLNSQGFGSAQLTQSAGHLLKTHLAASLIIYLQAAYIRADQKHLSIDSAFSPSTRRLIRVFCELNGLSLTDNWAVLSGVRNELKQAFVANVEHGIDTFAFEFTQDAVSSAQTDENDL